MSKTLFAIKNIALALDASPYSIAALDEAVLLAERLEANLIAICILHLHIFSTNILYQTAYNVKLTKVKKYNIICLK